MLGYHYEAEVFVHPCELKIHFTEYQVLKQCKDGTYLIREAGKYAAKDLQGAIHTKEDALTALLERGEAALEEASKELERKKELNKIAALMVSQYKDAIKKGYQC